MTRQDKNQTHDDISHMFNLWYAYLPEEPSNSTKADIDHILSHHNLQPDADILDLGCGTGRHLRELAKRGFVSLCGIDISREAIVRASRLSAEYSSIAYQQVSIADCLGQTERDYDCIMAMDMTLSMYEECELSMMLGLIASRLNDMGAGVIEMWDDCAVSDGRVGNVTRTYDIDAGQFIYRAEVSEDRKTILFAHTLITPEGRVVEFPPQKQYLYDRATLLSLARQANLVPDIMHHGSKGSSMLWVRRS